MGKTYALISTRFNVEGDGDWYFYHKQGFTPRVLYHKRGHQGEDVRRNHIEAGWHITPLAVYDVNDDDIDKDKGR